MGNGTSVADFNPGHIRMYKNLIGIQSPTTRAEMIQTILVSPEYSFSAKKAGFYGAMLQYVAKVQRGENPGFLPGEATKTSTQTYNLVTTTQGKEKMDPYYRVARKNGNEKALSYFQSCLMVLGLEEEVALTEETLRLSYKRAAMKAHPDKGGNERDFEAVTRAYAYLTEILRRISGGRSGPLPNVEAPSFLQTERTKDSENWQHVQPVRLNAQKLDLNAFNQMFEQTRIPDPEDEGYGDWLKQEMAGSSSKPFSGKFNQQVFNQMFEEEARKEGRPTATTLAIVSPQALLLAPSMGVEIGREKPADFTAPANAGLKYTDLKSAYTTAATFSGEVADVRVENRDLESYRSSRKRAPDPLSEHEMAAVKQAEKEAEERERQRQLRVAHEGVQAQSYFERMKQLVITDGVPLEKTKRY
jgi:curved DNA-binding protein CbpA